MSMKTKPEARAFLSLPALSQELTDVVAPKLRISVLSVALDNYLAGTLADSKRLKAGCKAAEKVFSQAASQDIHIKRYLEHGGSL